MWSSALTLLLPLCSTPTIRTLRGYRCSCMMSATPTKNVWPRDWPQEDAARGNLYSPARAGPRGDVAHLRRKKKMSSRAGKSNIAPHRVSVLHRHIIVHIPMICHVIYFSFYNGPYQRRRLGFALGGFMFCGFCARKFQFPGLTHPCASRPGAPWSCLASFPQDVVSEVL